MPDSGEPLDRLFMAPLKDFTATRNALASSAGTGGPAIRALEKPSAAAWAVNQVYWRYRRVYDKLVRASERIRAGHAQRLKGKRVDLAPLELAHRAAVKAAAAVARDVLLAADDAATSATMKAVQDTLEALPVDGPPGRLIRPPAPVGFDALGSLLQQAGVQTQSAAIVPFASPTKAGTAKDRRAEREAARAKAEASAREARRRALETKRKHVEGRLEEARLRLDVLTADLRTATSDVDSLSRELLAIQDELARIQ